MVESNSSAFSLITLYTSSLNKGAAFPVRGFTYSYKSVITSEKVFLVFLWRFETEILAARRA